MREWRQQSEQLTETAQQLITRRQYRKQLFPATVTVSRYVRL